MKGLRYYLLFAIITSFGLEALGTTQTQTLTAGTITETGSGISWSSPLNVQTENDTVASASFYSGGLITKEVRCSNFGFSLPAIAVVLGIKVRIVREQNGLGTVIDRTVQLLDDSGSPTGDDKASIVGWPITMGSRTYGDNSDDWGLTLSRDLVMDSDFGVTFSAQTALLFPTARVDAIEITVVYDDGYPLPVELTHFCAKRSKSGSVHLHWTTASETQSDKFNIQRSADGLHWTTIGEKKCLGDNIGEHHYAFEDKSVASTDCFYRLEQKDLDGSTTYSSVIGAPYTPPASQTTFFPNPAEHEITFEALMAPCQLTIIDLNGRRHYRGGIDPANNKVDVSTLKSGSYLLHLDSSEGRQTLVMTKP